MNTIKKILHFSFPFLFFGLLGLLMSFFVVTLIIADMGDIVGAGITSEGSNTTTIKTPDDPLVPTKNSAIMTIEWVRDPVVVRSVLDSYMEQNPESNIITGLAIVFDELCIVYAFEPVYENDRNMQILGHEMLHCFNGSFHK